MDGDYFDHINVGNKKEIAVPSGNRNADPRTMSRVTFRRDWRSVMCGAMVIWVGDFVERNLPVIPCLNLK
jgi:hypothetical protein